MVYYYLCLFPISVSFYFKVSFNLKIILYVTKITQLCLKTVFISSQERDHTITQLQTNLKDYEQEITKLKSQLFQEQQKLFERESEWKENIAKQDTHAKSLRIEVRQGRFHFL